MAKIYLVDDSMFQVTVTSQLLKDLGHEVSSSRDPLQAVDEISKGEYDCVIADHLMPGLNGVELMEKLKAGLPNLPVILLTSNIQKTVEQDAIEKGAAGFLAKPANKDVLGPAITNAIAA